MSASSLVLASGNAGKLREFSHLLAPLGIEPIPQGQLGVSDAEETGLTFVENALIKARHAAEVTGLPALADDSGIEVDVLGGEPGIYSARFAARRQQGSGDGDNNAALLAALEDVPEQARTARYWCVLVYLRHAADPVPIIVQASWEGRVLDAPQGEGGFGYDPLFWLPEHGMTAAALDAETKNRLSHRGRAMQQLLEALAAQSGQA
ncbi:RdgB/HAM1 family non-canonical purine NTP pyrophosphatase [Cobetia sp. cqz5-12]|uniref:RdgB/HAM1 family non-canonical purine NTP pyrophosphatase n=1 Tax=Cobetia sp. cqz5-12 TaxID=2609415 RepID=UPI0019052169|nr:RdgB/HAM1 family non-canonical purine NTP pyrophosphatase [Cobetia sp. cqz5-12]QQK65697.1 RdgB/HAM1 family non-canonical purine NTP pyrophosphatase [Cobetia sp. cqz5-12]